MIATEYDELDRELGELDGRRGAGRAARSGFRILLLAVGILSLFALGGIVWYAYSQGVREGSETAAPLLRPDTPAKAAPEDPGGRKISGIDLEVYSRVNGKDSAPASIERILPPPEEPKIPLRQTAPSASVPSRTRPEKSATVPAVAKAPARRELVPAPEVPDPKLAAPTIPPPTVDAETEQAAAMAVPESAREAPPMTGTSAAVPEVKAPAAEHDAGTGWRIQVAALKSEAGARAEWARLEKAHRALLDHLTLRIQQATVNGTTYFRVRGGPLSTAEAAKRLCAEMKAVGAACIPVAPGQ